MIIPLESMLIVAPRLGRWSASAWLLLATPSLWAVNAPQRPSLAAGVQCAVELPSTSSRYRGPNTYLAMVGPAPLRFAETPPPLPPEPVMPGPASPEPAARLPEQTPEVTPKTTAPSSSGPPPPLENPEPELHEGNPAKPVSILPDDIQREIRPEDVLPFFQYPGAGENVTVAVPFTAANPRAPALPASSATYQQK